MDDYIWGVDILTKDYMMSASEREKWYNVATASQALQRFSTDGDKIFAVIYKTDCTFVRHNSYRKVFNKAIAIYGAGVEVVEQHLDEYLRIVFNIDQNDKEREEN